MKSKGVVKLAVDKANHCVIELNECKHDTEVNVTRHLEIYMTVSIGINKAVVHT